MATTATWSAKSFRIKDQLFNFIAGNSHNAANAFTYTHHTWCAPSSWQGGAGVALCAGTQGQRRPGHAHASSLACQPWQPTITPPCSHTCQPATRSHQTQDSTTSYDADMQVALNKAIAGPVSAWGWCGRLGRPCAAAPAFALLPQRGRHGQQRRYRVHHSGLHAPRRPGRATWA